MCVRVCDQRDKRVSKENNCSKTNERHRKKKTRSKKIESLENYGTMNGIFFSPNIWCAPRRNDKRFIWHKQGMKSATGYIFFSIFTCVCLHSIYFNLAAYKIDVFHQNAHSHSKQYFDYMYVFLCLWNCYP